jgi:nitrogen fixation NifU-like protein
MFDDLDDLYQQVILDHSRSPRNFRKMESPTGTAQGYNPLCGDNVTLYVRMDQDKVQEVSFQGSGCAISKASASLLTEALKGKTAAEVRSLFEKMQTMVKTGQKSQSDLGKLAAFAGVHKFPARVKCAILPWHAVIAALENRNEPVSTE